MNDAYRDPHVGTLFLGRYRVVARLAKGGMGVVYLGRAEGAEGFRRPVVIKLIAPELGGEEDTSAMFLREAKVLARLQHPNIVSIVDFGQQAGAHVMVLDYIRGYPLSTWYRWLRNEGTQAPVGLACFIVEEVLVALQFVHSRQKDGQPDPVVHRDISPSNVLLTPEGQVQLVDFGIAKGTNATDEYATTDDRSVKGKFAYMAPELFRSQPATPQTDLYACGVMLRELLVGRNDFRGRDLSETVQRVMKLDPEPLGALRGDVSPELEAFVAKAHAKRPSERFRDATSMLSELRALRETTLEQARERLAQRLARDFDSLPQAMNTPRLDDRDALWRDEEFGSEVSDSPPTVVAKGPESATTTPAPSGGLPGWAWGVGALVLIAVAVGAFIGIRPATPAPVGPVFVAESRQEPVDETIDLELSGDASLDGAVDDEPEAERAATMVRAPSAGGVSPVALRRAMTRQQATLRRCFARHGGPDVDEVLLRARIATSGRVDQAEVLDPAVASHALGGCLVAAAYDLEFEPRRAPVFFRIPLRPH